MSYSYKEFFRQMISEKQPTCACRIQNTTGFSNPNYFYSIFKKETGLTPAAYRNAGQVNG